MSRLQARGWGAGTGGEGERGEEMGSRRSEDEGNILLGPQCRRTTRQRSRGEPIRERERESKRMVHLTPAPLPAVPLVCYRFFRSLSHHHLLFLLSPPCFSPGALASLAPPLSESLDAGGTAREEGEAKGNGRRHYQWNAEYTISGMLSTLSVEC